MAISDEIRNSTEEQVREWLVSGEIRETAMGIVALWDRLFDAGKFALELRALLGSEMPVWDGATVGNFARDILERDHLN